MSTKLVSLTLDIPHALVYSLMDRAQYECSEWAGVTAEEYAEADEHGYTPPRVLTVDEYGDEEKPQSTRRLALDEVTEGIRRVLLNDITVRESHALVAGWIRADLYRAIIDPDHDAHSYTVDCVIQAAALGRHVYN